MARFKARKNDVTWGHFNYPVTPSQKITLDGLWYMLSGLPRAEINEDLPRGGFYSQRPDNGDVLIGLNHCSVSVHRTGRLTSNEERPRLVKS